MYYLEGAVTTVEAGDLKQVVRSAIKDGMREIHLDLSQTEFIDSAGLGSFVALHKSAIEVGGNLHLCGLLPHVLAVFELTRLHRVLSIQDAVPVLDGVEDA